MENGKQAREDIIHASMALALPTPPSLLSHSSLPRPSQIPPPPPPPTMLATANHASSFSAAASVSYSHSPSRPNLPALTRRLVPSIPFASPSTTKISYGRSHKLPPFSLSPSSLSVRASAAADKKSVLIVNTNSGGHAIIGFDFAKGLLSSGHDVTILTVGDESSDKMKKPPFTRFSELVSAGGKTVWGDPAQVGQIVGSAKFDAVLDNNGKDLDSVKPVADWAKASGVKQFLYISSAGIYKTSDEIPHVEGDPVKGDAGHVFVEKYIAELSFNSWSIFRPQYMIGSGNNKDCEEWFFDRIVRDRPVPLPGSGMQLTNIAHVRDLSSMLSLAVGNSNAANGKIFNCVSDRAVTFDGLAKLCAQAAGKEVKIVHYDPKAVGIDARKAFPFRNMHFYAEPRAAKEALGWTGTTYLPEDLKERLEEYVKIGRDKKQMKFEIDDKILEYLKVTVTV